MLFVFVEKKGPAFLPMLSDTFVPEPGNYISRVTLSATSLIVAALGFVPYYAAKQPKECIPKGVLLGMSTVATACLATVGAVCESDNAPSCEGAETVHTTSAVVFFLLYDVYAITISLKHSAKMWREGTRGSVLMLALCIVVSVATKVRLLPSSWLHSAALTVGSVSPFAGAGRALSAIAEQRPVEHLPYHGGLRLNNNVNALEPTASDAAASAAGLSTPLVDSANPPAGAPLSSPWVAVLEYLDTGAIMVHLVTYITAMGGSFSYGTVRGSSRSSSSGGSAPTRPGYTIHASVGLSTLSLTTAFLALATIGGTFFVNLKQGTIHPMQTWPMISDLWVAKPSNMVSRYFVCLGGWLFAVCTAAHKSAVQAKRSKHPYAVKIGNVAGLASAVGLVLVGSCNEKENITLHSASAITFFAGFAVWALTDLYSSAFYWHGGTRAMAVVCFSVFGGCKLGQLCHWIKHGTWRYEDDTMIFDSSHPQGLAYAEWLSAAALIGYFALANTATHECKAAKIAFLEKQQPPTTTTMAVAPAK